jgi:hypothetical protein
MLLMALDFIRITVNSVHEKKHLILLFLAVDDTKLSRATDRTTGIEHNDL